MMMGGFGMFGWFFGLVFMFFFFALIAIAGVWLLRQITPLGAQPPRAGEQTTSSPVTRQCPTCGRSMQPEWSVCPYDGTPLSG